ncbi:alpha/beta fold hydrolase [Goodfellowiella coeruleoviolacea]|uniref:Pimeloyl-ACP methyl ester carboxylesterase n=1 Tax=Goodfellowiella coeruleoviolacea TaxID=334858 RepID=A0AAE3KMX2_9PSEU|nr:alpha/beta fold hydrolase [Goodfellowiella coeruleoviolacea]MCP2168098.1 Pimeloyl-ACP methyl ester carboxylesterase [Goodfellowiella coeruleoviolacea]
MSDRVRQRGDHSASAIYRSAAGAAAIRQNYLAILRRWPVPNEHLRVPTRQGETFVVASGPHDAPPLVLMHGSGTNAAMWLDDVTAWSEHFRVYAIDMIGEPGLSAPARPPLDSDAYALWLDDVLDGLGVTSASVVGASLGGWLGLDYATRRVDRVRRLSLLCPGGIGRQKYGWMFLAVPLRAFGRWGQRMTMRIGPGIDARDPKMAAFADHMASVSTHFRYRTAPLPIFSDDALRRLSMPVQVTVGDRDAMFDSAGTARRVRRTVPHAQVTVLAGVGHSFTGQTAAILAFLRADQR